MVIEDIGIGNEESVIDVLNIYASVALRRRVGDLKSALYVTELMCRSVKCRLADHLYISAPHVEGLSIDHLSYEADVNFYDLINDKSVALDKRALALWLLAGTKRFPSDNLPQRVGSIEQAIRVLNEVCKNKPLLKACIPVVTRTQYPLTLFMPLMASAIKNGKISHHPVSSEFSVTDELPHYAADTFTRIGKTCIRDWQKAVPDLKRFSTAQMGLGVFYLEGAVVDRELTNPELEGLKQDAELHDIEGAGLCAPEYLGLRELMTQSWPALQEIRNDRLTGYMKEQAIWGGQLI